VFASGLITTTQNVDRPRPRTAEEIQRLRSYALAILHDPVGEHPGVSKLPKCYPVPT